MIDQNIPLTAQANGAVTALRCLKRAGVANNLPDLAVATDGSIAGAEQLAGISIEGAADNAMFSYCASGPTWWVAGAAGIAAGVTKLTTDAAGKALAATAGTTIVAENLSGRAVAENEVFLVNVNISNWAVA